MANGWPDGWISATLRDADLPVSDFTRKVMQAWADSTPMLPYTNNPLGMPHQPGKTAELMKTGYALFVTMPAFRQAFSAFVNSTPGRAVHESLALSESYAQAYRAIHTLKWPANATETDWPSAVLDLMTESTRSRLSSVVSASDRKTTGIHGTTTAFAALQGQAARHAAQTAQAVNQATRAVGYLVKGVR